MHVSIYIETTNNHLVGLSVHHRLTWTAREFLLGKSSAQYGQLSAHDGRSTQSFLICNLCSSFDVISCAQYGQSHEVCAISPSVYKYIFIKDNKHEIKESYLFIHWWDNSLIFSNQIKKWCEYIIPRPPNTFSPHVLKQIPNLNII